jgi:hypothetical protein
VANENEGGALHMLSLLQRFEVGAVRAPAPDFATHRFRTQLHFWGAGADPNAMALTPEPGPLFEPMTNAS